MPESVSNTGELGRITSSAGFAYSYRKGSAAVIVMNRPEKLNAWTEAMRGEVVELLVQARDDDSVGAIVLTGTGRAFCAGQDFAESREFSTGDPARAEQWLQRVNDLYDVIRNMDKPTVAAINGVAAGSGFQVPLLFDVRVAHESAMLGQPEVNSGIPSITGTYLMTTYLGISRTTEMVLSGRMMTASEAHAAGVVHTLVTDEDVVVVAAQIAEKLANQPTGAFVETKNWLRAMTEEGYREAFRYAMNSHRSAYTSGEPQAMMEKFIDARQGNGRARNSGSHE